MDRKIELEERLGKLTIDGIMSFASLWHLDSGDNARRMNNRKKRSKNALIQFVAECIRDKARVKTIVSQLSDREKQILGVFALNNWVLESLDLYRQEISESELGVFPYNVFSYDFYSYYPRKSEIRARGILGLLLLVRVRKYGTSGPIVYVVPEEFRETINTEFTSKPKTRLSRKEQETITAIKSEGYAFLEDLFLFLSHAAGGITLTPSLHEIPKRTADKITNMLNVKTRNRLTLLLSVGNALKLVKETYKGSKPTLVTTGTVEEFLMQSRETRVMTILDVLSSNYDPLDQMILEELKRMDADVWYDRYLFYKRVWNALFQQRSRDWFAVNQKSLDRIFSHLRLLGLLEEGEHRDTADKARQVFLLKPAFFGIQGGTDERVKSVIVQPNFEIIALPETPEDVLFLLSRISELKTADKAHVFMLTKKTFLTAMDNGMDAEKIIALLKTNAKTEIPQNVLYSLKEWSESYGNVELRRGVFLEADPELMRVIKAKIRAQVIRDISDSSVILTKRGVLADLIKEEEGIFLEAVDAITAAEVEKAIGQYVLKKPAERIFVIESANIEKCRIALKKREIYPKDFVRGEDGVIHTKRQKKELIEEAIDEAKRIKMVYLSEGFRETERVIDPYEVGESYVEGYCHLRNEKRVFRLDRIKKVEMLEVQESGLACL